MTREQAKLAIENFEKVRLIGDLNITIPEPPKWNDIANYDKPIPKQKFEYTEQPARNEEPTEDFLKQEAYRFEHGYWFFNNGILEWITGDHYFILNYWKDKGRRMFFIDAQRDFFIWWWHITINKNIAIGILVTCRRFGKTVCGTGILYKRTATRIFQYAGIQSKTNPDAKGVFNKLIGSWTTLPNWLKPVDSGETRPATVLEFYEPRKRSSKDVTKLYGEALNSKVDFKSSEEGAYDGEELDTYFGDEEGKTLVANVKERQEVVLKCLMKGPTIRGKGLKTTTVEEMDKKGGKNFKLIWDAADMKLVNPETNRNPSLSTRLFIPADYGYLGEHPITGVKFVDEYGYSNRAAAKEYILSTWKGLEGNDLSSAQRKEPLTIKHVWQLKNFGGCFDNELLETQLDYLERTNDHESENAPKNLVRRVTFYRELQRSEKGIDDFKTIVKWRDDPKGHCEMVWDFDHQDQSNKKKPGPGNAWAPANEEGFAIGVDPVGATMTTGTEKSQAVCYVYRKGDYNDPENSGLMVLRFAPVQRMKFKADFHKYVMMLCEYYGCKANYESNIDDYYEKFIEEGFKNYVMWRPKCTIDPQRKNIKTKYGTPSNDAFALQKQTDIADEYIKTRYHKIYFVELVRQLIAFDPDDRTKFDDCIAFFMALIGGTERKGDNKPKMNGLSILPVIKNAS